MKEKLAKAFTRDLSLCVCQWWIPLQQKEFKRLLEAAYSDMPAYSDGQSAVFYCLQKDLDAIRESFFAKLSADPEFYLKQRAAFRKAVKELRDFHASKGKKDSLDKKTIAKLKDLLGALYPTYRFAIYLPSNWREETQKVLGPKAGQTIDAAFQDRIFSEGALEEFDALFRQLCANSLAKISQPTRLAKFLSESEVESLAQGKQLALDKALFRRKGWVLSKARLYASTGFQDVFSKDGYSFPDEKLPGDFLRGTVAFEGGIVSGKVRKIFSLEQLASFKQGEVLVTPMTSPDFIPAMKKALAIVTDEGGATCHAAIVSRELKVPCIVGTRSATAMLKDGDLVEVDAEQGTVRKL